MDLDLLTKAAAYCAGCELHVGRIKPVFSKGNPNADVMICGMVPANDENKAGLPFVGRAGKLLDKILAEVDWSLDDVYITNLVKCYLAAGLPLKQEWIDACLPYLIVQIDIIRPKVIITLGKDSSISLLGMDAKTTLGSIRGKTYSYVEGIDVVPTYHPSYILRKGGESSGVFKTVVEDLIMVKALWCK